MYMETEHNHHPGEESPKGIKMDPNGFALFEGLFSAIQSKTPIDHKSSKEDWVNRSCVFPIVSNFKQFTIITGFVCGIAA